MSDTRHGMQNLFFQNIPLIIFNNFNHDQHVVKTKFKGLKRQWSSKTTKEQLNDVSKWRQMPNTRHGMNNFFQNIPPIIFNNFNHDPLVVKTKFKGLKRQ